MRSSVIALAGVLMLGGVLLVLSALLHTTPVAFTTGVSTAGPVAPLGPGEELCQRPIPVPAGGAFDRIRVVLGTYDRPGPPLLVSVSRGGSTIATGHLSAGYADIAKEPSHIVHVRPVSAGGRIDVCLRNAGPNRVAVFGNADAATATSTAFRDGKPLHSDIGLIFERQPRSYASLAEHVIDRAALFRPDWVGSWTYVALTVLLLVGGPLLLWRALASAWREP